MLVGPVPLFLPLSRIQFGFNFGMPSTPDTLMECASFLVAALVAYRNGDIRRLLSVKPESFWSIIPLSAICSMTLVASQEFRVNLATYAFAGKNLSIISLSHITIAAFLTLSCLQGVRALAKPPRH
jgi:hypothetical protein